MSLSIDTSNKNVNLGNIDLSGLTGGGSVKGEKGVSESVLNGDGLTITSRDRSVNSADGARVDGAAVRTDEKIGETVQTLLENAAAIDEIVDDLTALAEQTGAVVPPDGASVPKLDLKSVQATTDAFNQSFGTSLDANFVNAAVQGGETITETAAAPTQTAAALVQVGAQAETQVEQKTASTADKVESSTKHSISDAMFSIYELISLMQQIGQSERDAARDLREAELSCEIASIDLQASMQRDAALWGLVATVVTCSMQICMTVAGAAASGANSGGTAEMKNTSGGQDLQQKMNTVNTLEAGAEGHSAQNLESVQSQTSSANTDAVNQRMEACGCGKAEAKYQSAAAKEQELIGDKANIDSKLNELKSMDTSGMTDEQKIGHEETVKSLEQQSTDMQGQIDSAHAETVAAKNDYSASLDKAMAGIQKDYNAASSATKGSEAKTVDNQKTASRAQNKQNVQDQKGAQANQKDLGEQRTLMEAKVTDAKCQMGEAPTDDQIKSAKGSCIETENDLKFDKGYQAALKKSGGAGGMAGQAMMQLAQVVGSLGQSISQYISQSGQSLATTEGATQKEMEAHRDETNDLFKQSGDLISSARQLLQSVIQAESGAVEQVIRA